MECHDGSTEKNFKFPEEKFVTGQNVKFAGLDLAAYSTEKVTIKPDRKRVEVLCQLKKPESEKEVQSLLGLISTFNKWVPDLSLKDKPKYSIGAI